jgi:hypothetical protein
MRSETFGRLLKAGVSSIAACEGKTAPIVEEDLGNTIGVAAASIQRYKAGHVPPETRTVEILAEAAVRRGHMDRGWLQTFLRAASYPAADGLLDRLCPVAAAPARPARAYQNLPAPTYSRFINRPQAEADVLDGLSQRSAVVLITSLGGMGKTSLAREVAACCLAADAQPHFDAVVWVSDKDRPGTTTLNSVLDEVARTLDYPGFTAFEADEKRREVEQLLRRSRVLLVVDNFETVQDPALLGWLLRLPEPSKALITSREYSRAFRNNTFVLDLRGMSDAEAGELIGTRLHLLRMERLAADPAAFAPLVAATGGNPKAIEIALGCLKYEHRPFATVLDDLYAARGELFDDLFSRCWSLLDEPARCVLLAMPLFQDSASPVALAATAGVSAYAFDRAVEQLTDLALLDVQQVDLHQPPRYTSHPLVRAFANARLGEYAEAGLMRDRWVAWYRDLVGGVGYCWADPSRLERLDPEKETIQNLLAWCATQGRDADVIRLADGVGYYYYIRGFWNERMPVDLLSADAAHRLGDRVKETEALAYHIHTRSAQGNMPEMERYLPRLRALADSTDLPGDIFFIVQHAMALYDLARRDIDAAQAAWLGSLRTDEPISSLYFVIQRQWVATCLYLKGALVQAQHLLRETLRDAEMLGSQRHVSFCKIRLAAIDLDLGELEAAADLLADTRVTVHRYQDREHIAQISQLTARLHTLRGDLPAARAALAEAADLFERLGMRPQLARARAELARLDEPLAVGG